MKKKVHKSEVQLDDYDFSQAIRGEYARRYERGTNIVILQPDVAKAFPTSKAVNSFLRKIIRQRTLQLAK